MANATPPIDRARCVRPTLPPDSGATDAVAAAQVADVFRQLPIALAVNLVNGALTAIVLTPLAPRPLPLLWFAAIVTVTVGRGLLWWRYRRAAEAADSRRWSMRACLGGLCAGLAWGVGGALLFPLVPPLAQLFLTIVIAGMCTGAIVLSASHLPSVLAFMFAASTPMTLRFLVQGTPSDSALSAMIAIFTVAMTFAARHLNGVFVETMRLRVELNETNQRLHAEIAEHRATEAALHQAHKLEAIGQLTGGIAHDFNNLLTVIIGNLTLAADRQGGNSTVAPLIAGAVQAAERGVALIQRLLGFARRQRLDPRPVDLDRLIAGIEQMLLRTLGPQVRLEVDVSPEVAPARVDLNQLELAILNLAVNARDAMPDGGTLRIGLTNRHVDSTSPQGLANNEYVVIEMADTGAGMDEVTLAKAFDPFFTTKKLGAGAGLGLPSVQGFAAQSGGAVRLSSELGSGTTVELWLPKSEVPPPDMGAAPQVELRAPRGDTQILVCDDDDAVRRFIGDYLGSIGYIVHEADRAETALRMLDGKPAISLLIADYAMPGTDGIETLRQARRRRPGLKALLITGHPAAAHDRAADVAILRKPFSPTDLAHKVDDVLAQ